MPGDLAHHLVGGRVDHVHAVAGAVGLDNPNAARRQRQSEQEAKAHEPHFARSLLTTVTAWSLFGTDQEIKPVGQTIAFRRLSAARRQR